jgi:MFS family permease
MSSERDPLLGAQHEDPEQTQDTLLVQKSRLPWSQLSIVFAIQFTEPVAATVIYPFIAQLVRDTGVTGGDEKKTGYYAGVIESIFFLAESLTVYQWGRASDSPRIGRRPVLLTGMLLSALSIIAFGLSKQFWLLVVTRAILGTCNGNIGVAKSVTAEITDSTNLGDAIAYLPITWALGVTLGPVIGGVLANPADRWSLFANSKFFREYPYFLPCFISALVPLGTFVMGYFYLKETLPAIKQKEEKSGQPQNEAIQGDAASVEALCTSAEGSTPVEADPQTSSFLGLLTNKRVLITVTNHSFLALMEQCFVILIPLMYSTSIPNGGLGFHPFKIGLILGVVGFINGISQLVFLSKAISRFGPRRLYMFTYGTVFIALIAYPIMNSMARVTGDVNPSVWVVLVIQQLCNITIYAAYGCSFIFIVDCAPSKASLGATNGLAQMVSTVMRTVSPTLASSLFSISIEQRIMGGTMVYWVLCAIGTIGIYTSWLLPRKLKQ